MSLTDLEKEELELLRQVATCIMAMTTPGCFAPDAEDVMMDTLDKYAVGVATGRFPTFQLGFDMLLSQSVPVAKGQA